jgi:hypothetical protein
VQLRALAQALRTKNIAYRSSLFVGCLAASFVCLPVTASWAETCVWRGTAPFCDGACVTGETTRRRESEAPAGDAKFGKSCTTGSKHLCCRPDPAPQGSSCTINGTPRPDISDADCEEARNTGCIRHLLTDKQYTACLAAQPGAIAAKKKACDAYSKRMDALVKEARKLKCDFLFGSGGWDQPFQHWSDQCNHTSNPETSLIPYNEGPLKQQVDKCRQDAAGGGGGDGGGNTTKIIAATTAYNNASGNGNEVCHLVVGDTVSVLGTEGNFTKISGNSGECKGQQGFVWNGDNALQKQ